LTSASAFGRRLVGPGLLDHDHVGRVDLVHRDERRDREHGLGRAAAVLAHRIALVVRAPADVQPGVNPRRHHRRGARESRAGTRSSARGADDFEWVLSLQTQLRSP
jgi:hypothetical protein